MPFPRRSLAGLRVGSLTVVAEAEDRFTASGNTIRQVFVRCDCGVEKVVARVALKVGKTVSCGCKKRNFARGLGLAAAKPPQVWTTVGDIATAKIGTATVTISAEDVALVSSCRWQQNKKTGSITSKKAESELHRLILGLRPGDPTEGDHKDHDRSNNTRTNLRLATSREQKMNRRKGKPVRWPHRYKGYTVINGRHVVQCQHGGINHTIRSFDREIDAALAYDNLARQLFGDRACVNFPAMWTGETHAYNPLEANRGD